MFSSRGGSQDHAFQSIPDQIQPYSTLIRTILGHTQAYSHIFGPSSDMYRPYPNHIGHLGCLAYAVRMPGICRAYAGHMPGICQACAGHISGICQACARHMPGVFRAYAGRTPGMCRAYARHIPGLCRAYAPHMRGICPRE